MVHLGALSKPRATELSKSKGFQLRPLKIPINTNWPSCVCQGMQLHEYQVNPALPPFFLPCHLPAAPAAISQQHGAAAEPAGSRGWFEPWAPSSQPCQPTQGTALSSGGLGANITVRFGDAVARKIMQDKLNMSVPLFHKEGEKNPKPKPNSLLITNNIKKHEQNKSFSFSKCCTSTLSWSHGRSWQLSALQQTLLWDSVTEGRKQQPDEKHVRERIY